MTKSRRLASLNNKAKCLLSVTEFKCVYRFVDNSYFLVVFRLISITMFTHNLAKKKKCECFILYDVHLHCSNSDHVNVCGMLFLLCLENVISYKINDLKSNFICYLSTHI